MSLKPHFSIISASVRTGRASHRVALFFEKFVTAKQIGTTTLIDLQKLSFPLFEERLQYQQNPSEAALAFASQITSSDAVIIVTPEYNGGYPASLKNALDLLYPEWYRKPVGVVTVSDGSFGGSQVITSLLFSLWKMKAWVVPGAFPVPDVLEAFNEEGEPADRDIVERRAGKFIGELQWQVEAKSRMKEYRPLM
jgi:NAD(P)H-dependent FMN reductase